MKRPSHLFAALLSGVPTACSDDPASEEPAPLGAVVLWQGASTERSLSFSVTPPDGATECRYLCLASGEPFPDADAILASGEVVAPSGTTPVTIGGLESDTEYSVAAVASNAESGRRSEIACMTMKTGVRDYDLLLEATSGTGVYYGHSTGSSGANYYIYVTDAPLEGVSVGAGRVLYLDLYGETAGDPLKAVVPEGRYEFDARDAHTAGTMGKAYTTCIETDEMGQAVAERKAAGGYVEVAASGAGIRIEGRITLDDGAVVKIFYDGIVPLANQSGVFGRDIELKITGYDAEESVYYGDPQQRGYSEYFFILYGTPAGDESVLPPDYVLRFDLWGDTAPDSSDARIPQGSYPLSADGAVRTLDASKTAGMAFLDPQAGFRLAYREGVTEISGEGGRYVMQGRFTLSDGHEVRFTYEGPLHLVDKAPAKADDETVVFDRAEGVYFGDLYGYGTASYGLEFASADGTRTLYVDCNDTVAAPGEPPVLNEGTFTCDEFFEAYAGGFYIGEDYGAYYMGTYYVARDADGAQKTVLIDGGTFAVSRHEGRYAFEFDFTTASGTTFRGSYEGTVAFEDRRK